MTFALDGSLISIESEFLVINNFFLYLFLSGSFFLFRTRDVK